MAMPGTGALTAIMQRTKVAAHQAELPRVHGVTWLLQTMLSHGSKWSSSQMFGC